MSLKLIKKGQLELGRRSNKWLTLSALCQMCNGPKIDIACRYQQILPVFLLLLIVVIWPFSYWTCCWQ